jgi:hypothetical protein
MTTQGPALCLEFLPYSEKDYGFVTCHGELPCNKEHAKTPDVAERFRAWGYNQALMEVYFCLISDIPINELKQFITESMEEE